MRTQENVIDDRSKGIQAFAEKHAISVPTAWRLIARGELVARKIGRRTIITAQDESAWLESLPRVRATRAAA